MIKYFGYENGKHKLFETDECTLLDFQGPDADKFVQAYPPKTENIVKFTLTEREFLEGMLGPPVDPGGEFRVESAERWEVGLCQEGHTVVTLLDKFDEPFAEAHIGDEENVDRLIIALIGACRKHTVERFKKLIVKLTPVTNGTSEEVEHPQLAPA